MKLNLDLRPEWSQRGEDSGKRLVIVHPESVVIEIEPLLPIPEEARSWIEAAMARDLPPGVELQELTDIDAKNDLGWPMEMVAAAAVDASGRTLEQRIGAFYKFNEWGAHAMVRARDAAALDEARAAVIAALSSGRPDWRGPYVVASIAELWT